VIRIAVQTPPHRQGGLVPRQRLLRTAEFAETDGDVVQQLRHEPVVGGTGQALSHRQRRLEPGQRFGWATQVLEAQRQVVQARGQLRMVGLTVQPPGHRHHRLELRQRFPVAAKRLQTHGDVVQARRHLLVVHVAVQTLPHRQRRGPRAQCRLERDVVRQPLPDLVERARKTLLFVGRSRTRLQTEQQFECRLPFASVDLRPRLREVRGDSLRGAGAGEREDTQPRAKPDTQRLHEATPIGESTQRRRKSSGRRSGSWSEAFASRNVVKSAIAS
jgi:hypothetical protein